ncbi:MAG: sialidase family protein [Acidimicrobiia bacterium]
METTPAGPDLEDIRHGEQDVERLRLSRAWIGGVAFLAVAIAILPFGLAPSRTGEVANTTVRSGAAPNQPVIDLGAPIWERPGEVSLGPIVETPDGFLVTGIENTHEDPWPAFTLTSTDGRSWTEVWRQVGATEELSAVSDGTAILAISTSTNSDPSLSRWSGESWQELPLPLPAGTAEASVQVLGVTANGWLAAGLSSPSSYDERTDVTVWRSRNGGDWTSEVVSSDVGTIFYLHHVLVHDGVETIVASARLDERAEIDGADSSTSPPHPLLIRNVAGSWQIDDLSPLTAHLTEPAMVNLRAIDSRVVDGLLLTWWQADNGNGDQPLRAMFLTRVSRSGEPSADEVVGPLLDSIVVDDSQFYALGNRDPLTDTPATQLMRSIDGVTWAPVGALNGASLLRLYPTRGDELLATGHLHDAVNAAAIWLLSAPSSD